LRVTRPNQVWTADITYLPMRRGFLYLIAIMDWHTRKVLAWRISNTLEADFCVEALNEAIARFGPPKIMNTDQGSQFTSFAWTNQLRRSGVRISMDGKGRFLDNIFVEQLWRTPGKPDRMRKPALVSGSSSTTESALIPPLAAPPQPWSIG
jgi:putative transposase